jgi:hypothetical protein
VANQDVKKGHWSPEEDEMIIALIKKHGFKWAVISSHLAGRYFFFCCCFKTSLHLTCTCESHFFSFFLSFFFFFRIHSFPNSPIFFCLLVFSCSSLFGRTDNAVKNRFNGCLKKLVDRQPELIAPDSPLTSSSLSLATVGMKRSASPMNEHLLMLERAALDHEGRLSKRHCSSQSLSSEDSEDLDDEADSPLNEKSSSTQSSTSASGVRVKRELTGMIPTHKLGLSLPTRAPDNIAMRSSQSMPASLSRGNGPMPPAMMSQQQHHHTHHLPPHPGFHHQHPVSLHGGSYAAAMPHHLSLRHPLSQHHLLQQQQQHPLSQLSTELNGYHPLEHNRLSFHHHMMQERNHGPSSSLKPAVHISTNAMSSNNPMFPDAILPESSAPTSASRGSFSSPTAETTSAADSKLPSLSTLLHQIDQPIPMAMHPHSHHHRMLGMIPQGSVAMRLPGDSLPASAGSLSMLQQRMAISTMDSSASSSWNPKLQGLKQF